MKHHISAVTKHFNAHFFLTDALLSIYDGLAGLLSKLGDCASFTTVTGHN